MTQSISLAIAESSQTGDARRIAMRMAAEVGLNETDRGALGVVVTEIATNQLRHAGGGEIVLNRTGEGPECGIEVLGLDTGPGIAHVERAMEDGFSTGGTPGNGLGAVRRLAAIFDIYSVRERGTGVVARVMATKPGRRTAGQPEVEFGGVNRPYPGERDSGDAWAHAGGAGVNRFVVADGLGHGLLAHQASQLAIETFRANNDKTPRQMLEHAHGELRSTRGAAAAIAELSAENQTIRYCGIGNISASVVTPSGTRSMVSHNGTIGLEMRKVQEFDYPWPYGAVLVMHSDGLATHWTLDAYPGLLSKHPALIAGILYRDHKRDRDDTTVIAARAARS